jgi:hypothetical protein
MRHLIPCLLVVLLPSAASAAPSYWIGYDNGALVVNSATPFVRDSLWSKSTGFFTYAGASHGYAMAGGAGVNVASYTDFLSGYAVQTAFVTNAGSMTDDFIISGPPGVTSVTGTFYFWVHGKILVTGGSDVGWSNGGIFYLSASAAGLGFWGSMQVGLTSLIGQGWFGGLSQNAVAMSMPMTGTFPVGTPFTVRLECILTTAHYGNNTVTPSEIDATTISAPDGFVSGVGNGLGYVMDLPAGYDLSSPSWNVVHNHMAPTLDVPREAARSPLAFSVGSGNPSSGRAVLRFSLPADADADLAVYDVEGRQVRSLARGWRAAGAQSVEWDGRDESGTMVAPGVYFATLHAQGRSASVRLVRLR